MAAEKKPGAHVPSGRDLNAREVVALVPIIILIFIIGLFPNLVFNATEPSATKLVGSVQVAARDGGAEIGISGAVPQPKENG